MPRKGPLSRNWCFTINNYTDESIANCKAIVCRYIAAGYETGSQGTPHIQGYVVFKERKGLVGVQRLLGNAHWEIAKGSHSQASDYCKKDGNFWESGEIPHQGKRTDISNAVATLEQNGLKRCAEEHPEVYIKYSRGLRDYALITSEPYEHVSVRGIWIYGPPGTGKSHAARSFDPDLYIKPQNKWWDGYDSQETVLLDDLDTHVLGHYLKIWADKWSCTGETKGGTVQLRHKLFVVTSNLSIDELFDEEHMREAIARRFKVIYKNAQCELVDFLRL